MTGPRKMRQVCSPLHSSLFPSPPACACQPPLSPRTIHPTRRLQDACLQCKDGKRVVGGVATRMCVGTDACPERHSLAHRRFMIACFLILVCACVRMCVHACAAACAYVHRWRAQAVDSSSSAEGFVLKDWVGRSETTSGRINNAALIVVRLDPTRVTQTGSMTA